MFAVTNSIGMFGMNAFPVTVEAEVFKGHPQFDLSGLPDTGIKESRDRVRSAAASLGIQFPKGRVLINLAPADVKKSGSSFDLAIFVCLMQAMDILPLRMPERIFIGELGLHGTVRSVRGVMTMTMLARKNGCQEIYVPEENVREAAVIDGIQVYGISTVEELMLHLVGQQPLKPEPYYEPELRQNSAIQIDFSDVRGQFKARSGMELAAAGGHNVIMIGAPGSGKTMLSKRIPSILPPFTLRESLETTKIHSVAGTLPKDSALMTTRPFRSPHHTISDVALVGGGTYPQPGEISLAHNGVLFLDELPEFKRQVLEVLRQPLEDREITISRAKFSVNYPASFMLVASMNPCPCGYYNHPEKQCVCSASQVKKYLNRISGPLLDRIDIHVEVVPVPFKDLSITQLSESSAEIRKRVVKAREIQQNRFADSPKIHCNAQMTSSKIRTFCQIDDSGMTLLKNAMEKLGLSARAYDRILKVSRTIADLEGSENIKPYHIAEAIQYRSLDRENWGM